MLRHALKLIWNRKRANALIIVELSLAFLIVFFVSAVGFHMLHRWHQPLGFEWQDTLEVMVQTGGQWTEEDGATLARLLATLRDQPGVEWAHMAIPPFRNWSWSTDVVHDDRKVRIYMNRMTDGAPEDFGVELLEGRFFDEADATPDRIPVILDEGVAKELFPDGFVAGTDIRDYEDEPENKEAWIALGVFRAFRQHGELSRHRPYIIQRFPVEDASVSAPTLQVKVESGTPISIEEDLQAVVDAEAPTWSSTVTPLSKLRQNQIREVVVPMAVAFWIALFLLLMVAFGLFGVLWQNVTRRTDELGLRRALGAHRRRVYRLIVLETLIMAGMACLLGCVIAIQFPITSGFEVLDWRSSSSALGAGLACLLSVAALCSLYPAWLASRRSPAEALHYE